MLTMELRVEKEPEMEDAKEDRGLPELDGVQLPVRPGIIVLKISRSFPAMLETVPFTVSSTETFICVSILCGVMLIDIRLSVPWMGFGWCLDQGAKTSIIRASNR